MYCSPNRRVSAGTTVCPAGTELAGKPPISLSEAAALWPENFSGYSPSDQPVSPTVTGREPSWNADTDPVRISVPAVPADRLERGTTGVPTEEVTTTVYAAKGYVNQLRGRDPNAYEDLVNDLRIYTGSELGTVGAVEGAWSTVLKDAKLAGRNAMDLLKTGPEGDGRVIDPGAGTRGVSGYAGPRTTVTMASERDLRSTADAVASTVLGRAVTDEEFQGVLKRVRQAERTEPTVTTSGVGSTVTQAGLTAEGRQNIITEALMQGPEAEDFGKATKMMDLFYSALEARPQGA